MNASTLDWRLMIKAWPESDIRYVASIFQEELNRRNAAPYQRRVLISKED